MPRVGSENPPQSQHTAGLHGLSQPHPALRSGKILRRLFKGRDMAGYILDLPPGELPALDESAGRHGIDIISFLAPNSSDARIKEVAREGARIYLPGLGDWCDRGEEMLCRRPQGIYRPGKAGDKPAAVHRIRHLQRRAGRTGRRLWPMALSSASRIIQLMEDNDKSYKKLRDFLGETRRGHRQVNLAGFYPRPHL